MNPAVVFAWLAEIGLVTWRDFQSKRTLAGFPPPSDYAATFVVFGGLLAVSSSSAEGAGTFAGVVAWGLVLATAINLLDPTLNGGNGNALSGLLKAPGQQPSAQTGGQLTAGAPLVPQQNQTGG